MAIEVSTPRLRTQFGFRQADGAVETSGGRVAAPPVTIPHPAGASFDYSTLDRELANEARAAAGRIRERLRTATYETGRDLIAIKDKMPHGTFGSWVAAEFGISDHTAQNYMNAARFMEGKSETVSLLPPTALYALARPTASAEVVDEVLKQVDAGVPVTTAMIRDRLAGAVAAQKKADARKSDEQLNKEREADKRHRALEEKRDRERKEEQAAIEAREAEVIENTARFLVDKLGVSGVHELFTRMRNIPFHRLERLFQRDFAGGRSPTRLLTEAEIETKFGHRGAE
jgi:hypothetical protein